MTDADIYNFLVAHLELDSSSDWDGDKKIALYLKKPDEVYEEELAEAKAEDSHFTVDRYRTLGYVYVKEAD